ncbi:MAG: hypothetical protein U0V75_16800 [Ferruginibacter sp.]
MQKLLLLCFCAILCRYTYAQEVHDSSAIKKLLETESSTWRSGDEKGHADCWEVKPYSRILVSTPSGQCFDVPPSSMIHPPAGMMGKGGYATNSNYLFSIHGYQAWVSHDEVSVAADGTRSYSHEMRMLEKINGRWKLVGQSIHLYNPQ